MLKLVFQVLNRVLRKSEVVFIIYTTYLCSFFTVGYWLLSLLRKIESLTFLLVVEDLVQHAVRSFVIVLC